MTDFIKYLNFKNISVVGLMLIVSACGNQEGFKTSKSNSVSSQVTRDSSDTSAGATQVQGSQVSSNSSSVPEVENPRTPSETYLAEKVAIMNSEGWYIGFKHQSYVIRMPNSIGRNVNLFSFKNIQINGELTLAKTPACSSCNEIGMQAVNAMKEADVHLKKVAFMFQDKLTGKLDTVIFERQEFDRSAGTFSSSVMNEMTSVRLTVNGKVYSNRGLDQDIRIANNYVVHWEVATSGGLVSYYRLSIVARDLNGNIDPNAEIERFVIEPSREFYMIQGGYIKAGPEFLLMAFTSKNGIRPDSTLPNGSLGVSSRWLNKDGANIFVPETMGYIPQGGGVLESIDSVGTPFLSVPGDQTTFSQNYTVSSLTDTKFNKFTNCFTQCLGQKASELDSDQSLRTQLLDIFKGINGDDSLITNNKMDQYIFSRQSRSVSSSSEIDNLTNMLSYDYDKHSASLGKVFQFYKDPEEDLEINVSRGFRDLISPTLLNLTWFAQTTGFVPNTEHIGIRIGSLHIMSYQHNFALFVNGNALNLNGASMVDLGGGYTYEQHSVDQTDNVLINFPPSSKYENIYLYKSGQVRVTLREFRQMPASASGIFAEQIRTGKLNPLDIQKFEVANMFSR